MPDLPVPTTPVEQRALRKMLDAIVLRYGGSVRCDHEDRFWESKTGREMVYGWGTTIALIAEPARFVRVWFDGLDQDIALSTGTRDRQWREWRDLTDLDGVLREVEEEIIIRLS